MALPFGVEELEGSPLISINEDGTRATRMFRLPGWDLWPAFARELIGRFVLVGGNCTFVRPLAFPGHDNLIVHALDIAPLDPARPVGGFVGLEAGANRYPSAGAKVTAQYRTLFDINNLPLPDSPGVPEGTFLTFRADLGAESERVPGRNWVWDIAGEPTLPDDLNPHVLRPSGAYTLTWHRVLCPPWDAIRSLRGKINASSFLNAPAETVLFLGAKVTRQFQFLEEGGFWEISYSFAESTKKLRDRTTPVGWNHFFRRATAPGEENWTLIKAANSAPPERPYQAGDFDLLFQFG